MSSEDQDISHSLTPLLPASLLASIPPPELQLQWRGSSQLDGSQPIGQPGSQHLSDSQFDTMGQNVGFLPPPPELVLPAQTSTFPVQTAPAAFRLPSGPLPLLQHHAQMLDSGQGLLASPPVRHPSVCKAEHKNSKAARRGPMDEMRQLVRILVKLIPESSRFLTVPDEGGGGNRVKEEHIKDYLSKLLGRNHDSTDEAPPYPEWGLGNGWAAYLSHLFTWARGTVITPDQALRCARRLPGRSWETLNEELEKLRLCPAAWPLPLRRDAVREVQRKYEETGQLPAPAARAPQPVQLPHVAMQLVAPAPEVVAPVLAAAVAPVSAADAIGREIDMSLKRPFNVGDEGIEATQQVTGLTNGQLTQPQLPFALPSAGAAAGYYQGPPGPSTKRRRKPLGADLFNLSDYAELELMHLLMKVLAEVKGKLNTTPAEKLGDLLFTRDYCNRFYNECFGRGAPGASPYPGQAGLPLPAVPAPYHGPLGQHPPPPAALGAMAAAPGPAIPPAPGADAAAAAQSKARQTTAPPTSAPLSPELLHALQALHNHVHWAKPSPQPQQQPVVQPQHSVAGATPGGGLPPVQHHHQHAVVGVQAPTPLPSTAPTPLPLQLQLQPQASSVAHTVGQPPTATAHSHVHTPPSAPSVALQPPQPPSVVSQPPQPAVRTQPPPSSNTAAPSGGEAKASSGSGSGASGSGSGIVKPTVVSAPETVKVTGSKEATMSSGGKPGDVRLGSSSGAFKSYDKSGGLDALAAAAAAAVQRDKEHDEGEVEGRSPPAMTASRGAPQQPLPQSHNTAQTPGTDGPTQRESHPDEQRRGQVATSTCPSTSGLPIEEMDETEIKARIKSSVPQPAESAAETDNATAYSQPASSSAPPRNTSELRHKLHKSIECAGPEAGDRQTQQQKQQQRVWQQQQQHPHQQTSQTLPQRQQPPQHQPIAAAPAPENGPTTSHPTALTPPPPIMHSPSTVGAPVQVVPVYHSGYLLQSLPYPSVSHGFLQPQLALIGVPTGYLPPAVPPPGAPGAVATSVPFAGSPSAQPQ